VPHFPTNWGSLITQVFTPHPRSAGRPLAGCGDRSHPIRGEEAGEPVTIPQRERR
jgi:hypothetical protein